jgi:hypothetical protein
MKGSLDEPVQIALFVAIIVIVITILFSIFFQAPSPVDLMNIIIKEGIKLVWGGIKQAALSLTTLG